jgi:hypothetical protein
MLRSHWLDCRTRTCSFGEPRSSRLRQRRMSVRFSCAPYERFGTSWKGGECIFYTMLPTPSISTMRVSSCTHVPGKGISEVCRENSMLHVQQKSDVVLYSESRGEAASEPYRFAPSPIVTQFVQSTEVGSRTLQHLLALLAFPRLHAQHKPRNLQKSDFEPL